jgi:hypothetical protein
MYITLLEEVNEKEKTQRNPVENLLTSHHLPALQPQNLQRKRQRRQQQHQAWPASRDTKSHPK